jgi:single-strand DNA-binding protein
VWTPVLVASPGPLPQILSADSGQTKRNGANYHVQQSHSHRPPRTKRRVKTSQSKNQHVIVNVATQESRQNEKGGYENRTECHRVYAWKNLSKFAKRLQTGQLITLEGVFRYREVGEEFKGVTLKHWIAEIHAISMKRLSKRESTDDPAEGAGERIKPSGG